MKMTAAARKSATEHPFYVKAWTSWADHDPLTVGFQAEADARAFAAGRPEPLIDLVKRETYANGRPTGGGNVIAARRMLAHPGEPGIITSREDAFPKQHVRSHCQQERPPCRAPGGRYRCRLLSSPKSD